MELAKKLKVGDLVRVVNYNNCLNIFMEFYKNKTSIVLQVKEGSNGGQLARLAIDGKTWLWSYNDKLHQIDLVDE